MSTPVIEELRTIADGLNIRPLADLVLDDVISNKEFLPALAEKFSIWSGSSNPKQHHYGSGGLAKHTLEVVKLSLLNNKFFDKRIDERKVYLTALYHDVGKIWDYQKVKRGFGRRPDPLSGDVWINTNHKRKIYHISRSAIIWSKVPFYLNPMESLLPVYRDMEEEVLHAILAHHGQPDWGSPVTPNSCLAWLLHLCDGLSARFDDCEKFDR